MGSEAATSTTASPPSTVYVVDGLPDYHYVASCTVIVDKPADELFDIPFDQAVEDGFAPCRICAVVSADDESDAAVDAGADAGTSSPGGGAAGRDVWVVDGLPDYHDAGCAELIGKDAVDIPFDQAVEDGFAPCPVCQGAAVAVAGEPQPEPASVPPASTEPEAAPAGERVVWVVDGLPDYHDAGCAELVGKDAVDIPFDQAVEDGFAPCPTCQHEAAASAEQPEPEPEPEPAFQHIGILSLEFHVDKLSRPLL